MSKKEINKYTYEQRLKRIANCTACKGSPPTKTVNLQGLVFQMCDQGECMEIIGDYRKEGAAIKVEKKLQISATHADPDYKQEITIDTIPGISSNK